MANPRKFSEKIALHNQKQAEETAAFQQIMKEVMDVRPIGGPTTPTSSGPQPIIQSQNPQQQQNHLSISLANYRGHHGGSLPNVNQMAQHLEKGSVSPRGCYQPSMSPRSQRNSIGPVHSHKSRPNRSEMSPYASPPSASMLSSSMSSATAGGFGSTGLPGLMSYAPNTYLSPPMDSSCRRFNSDSALNLNTLLIPSTVPDSSEDSSNNSNDNYAGVCLGLNRSPLHDPIAINNNHVIRSPSGGDGHSLLELPPVSMSSTGSLPDLTNFHFPPPLQHPVDLDDHNQQNHSPYSTSPLTGSSITYSPTSSHASPQGAGGAQPGTQQLQSQVQISQSPRSPGSQQPLLDNPLQVNTSFQNFPNDNMLSAYRSPQRPSPQNSPSPQFRSASPLDGQLSGPSSPSQGQTTQTPANDFYISQQALQQHFEQISVRDGGHKGNHMHMARQWQQGSNPGGPYFYTPPGPPNPGVTAVSSQQSPQHQQPQTPQTPSSIPDIIFTEFLGTDFSDPRGTDQLQLEELLAASEQMQAAFRDGLGQIDFDGFQMLDQPDLVQLDPQVEDSFRLDRL